MPSFHLFIMFVYLLATFDKLGLTTTPFSMVPATWKGAINSEENQDPAKDYLETEGIQVQEPDQG